MEQQKIQTQSQGIVQQTQVAEQERRKTMELEQQFALQKIQAEGQKEIMVLQAEAQLRDGQAVLKSNLKKSEKSFETTLPEKP